jgi:hypothetical protein
MIVLAKVLEKFSFGISASSYEASERRYRGPLLEIHLLDVMNSGVLHLVYILSKKLSNPGISGFKPLRFLAFVTTAPGADEPSNGSPFKICQ